MIQIVNLSKGQIITKNEIQNKVNNARSTFNYAKFRFGNNLYITVTYNRDLTISINSLNESSLSYL